eukprot:TRINITY_DN4950_c0_g2_i5.p1 TRINITY_DN4950_c0_g2~~TRINITY_DN4950_c0_g2_i5.p1  ORF type:complete len:209 (-),score=-11.95 TRINITY_DN4950_c0_g2_i5:105-731(-)
MNNISSFFCLKCLLVLETNKFKMSCAIPDEKMRQKIICPFTTRKEKTNQNVFCYPRLKNEIENYTLDRKLLKCFMFIFDPIYIILSLSKQKSGISVFCSTLQNFCLQIACYWPHKQEQVLFMYILRPQMKIIVFNYHFVLLNIQEIKICKFIKNRFILIQIMAQRQQNGIKSRGKSLFNSKYNNIQTSIYILRNIIIQAFVKQSILYK